MPDLAPQLTLDVDGVDAEWQVAAVRGREEISRPWRYEVELYINDAEPLSLEEVDDVVGKDATLTIEREEFDDYAGQKRELRGIVAEFHFLGAVPNNWEIHRYRAVVVPPLWLASLRRQSRILATDSDEKTDVAIVMDALTEDDPLGAPGLLDSDDIDDSGVTGDPPDRNFVMQYEETDLDFYHRRLEKCGVFYIFEDDGKIRLCDANVSVPRMVEGNGNGNGGEDGSEADLNKLVSRNYAGMTHTNARIVTHVGLRDTLLPEKLAVLDYNYEKPDLDLSKEHDVSDSGRGVWALVGENYGDTDPGEDLAQIRAEELASRERVLDASTPVIELCAGRVFTLDEHPVDALNQDYLVVSADIQAARGGAEWLSDNGVADGYQCRFRAIPKDTAFRPSRTTPVPRIAGVLSAVIDGENEDEPNLDDDGRYLIWFRFDHPRPNPAGSNGGSGGTAGQASAQVRLMTPFGGEPEGMHMPLRKGTEVLVGFVNGDVDRPVILGTVPNANRPAVVKNINRGSSVIRTSSGVVVTLADFGT